MYDASYKDYMPSVITSSVEFHHEYSEGGTRRGINRNFTLRNIRVIGDKPLIFVLRGNDAAHMTHHIAIESLTYNGVAVTDPVQLVVRKNECAAALSLDGKEF